ncbi:MAG: carbon storage regulator [Planctomycetales bacterium]|nr:carbon storage regulator [Planctomycetales bacterium]
MLVLSRKLGERIRVGDNVELVVLKLKGSQVVLGVDAPREVKVVRSEIAQRDDQRPAADAA